MGNRDGTVFMVVASLQLACSKSSTLAQQLRHDNERNKISVQYQRISKYIWGKVCTGRDSESTLARERTDTLLPLKYFDGLVRLDKPTL